MDAYIVLFSRFHDQLTEEEKQMEAMLTKDFKKGVKIAVSSCRILEFNVEDLLALPRIKQGMLPKNISSVSIKDVVQEVNDIMSYKAEAKRVAVETIFHGFPQRLADHRDEDQIMPDYETDYSILIDFQRFQQIALNYLSNAIKFSKQNGKIRVLIQLIPKLVQGNDNRGHEFTALEFYND